ncbi:hypothetical protein GF324_13560 [bacterium]|nr:hypothetical protein [bacterium]
MAEPANDRYQAGEYTLTFDGSGLPSGVYFVRAEVPGQFNRTRKTIFTEIDSADWTGSSESV